MNKLIFRNIRFQLEDHPNYSANLLGDIINDKNEVMKKNPKDQRVQLREKNVKTKKKSDYFLVRQFFVNENDYDDFIHINGNKLNNTVFNLKWKGDPNPAILKKCVAEKIKSLMSNPEEMNSLNVPLLKYSAEETLITDETYQIFQNLVSSIIDKKPVRLVINKNPAPLSIKGKTKEAIGEEKKVECEEEKYIDNLEEEDDEDPNQILNKEDKIDSNLTEEEKACKEKTELEQENIFIQNI